MYIHSISVVRSLLLLLSLAVFTLGTPLLERRSGPFTGGGYGQCAPLGAPWSHPDWKASSRDVSSDPFEPEAPALEKRSATTRLDAFYKPPKDFDCKAPGTILKRRKIATGFFTGNSDPVTTYELLYRTTAINGSAIATVTTVFVPASAKRDRFVSFHTAYDSAAQECSPSYNYILNGTNNNGIVTSETFIIQLYLQAGYIVSSPDYEGPEAAFAAGRLEAMGVLDGMRAVANFRTLKFSVSKPMIVGVGYSGGAIATGWAAQLQQRYAPELNIKGWSAGGTPANLTGTLVYDDNTVNSGFLPIAVVGLSRPSSYGCQLQPVIDKIATKEGQAVLHDAETTCAGSMLSTFRNKSILTTEFQSLGHGLLTNKVITSVLADTLMGRSKRETPVKPVFLFHGQNDDTIPYQNASTLAKAWCGNGASVNFTTFGQGGHVDVAIRGIPYALDFVASAFAGTVKEGCSSTFVE